MTPQITLVDGRPEAEGVHLEQAIHLRGQTVYLCPFEQEARRVIKKVNDRRHLISTRARPRHQEWKASRPMKKQTNRLKVRAVLLY